MIRPFPLLLCAAVFLQLTVQAQQPPAPLPSSAGTAYVVKAGRLIDPETGMSTANQMISVKDGRIIAIGGSVTAPEGAEVVDLSGYSVLPGLVDAHNHLALTYKKVPENDVYYYTYIQESTALRAIEAASNGMQMLSSGFTVVRDLGNNGLYADTALRQAIRAGLDSRPDTDQLRNHHRRHRRAVFSDARNGEGTQHRLSGISRRGHA
jgi:predicted amidohydrolase